ncbi:MAG: exosome complex RNA-binding protein Rrp4 [Candidatus Pacearchaeota archaeon]
MEEIKEKTERRIVVPGEIVVSGYEYLPSEGCIREEENIIAIRYGLVNIENNLVKIIPLTGVYIPRVGNIVIGQIKDIVFNGWIVDIFAPHLAFLGINECNTFIDKEDLSAYYDVNDIIIAKIKAIQPRAITLTLKERGLGKISEGLLIKVGPAKVPRIIGKAGSMINTIKEATNAKIIVGQNGLIWIKADNIEKELAAKEAIELVAENPLLDGLTEKIKKFLEEKLKK